MPSASHITRERSKVRAASATWRDGIPWLLPTVSACLMVANDLLTESGSIFVQIRG